MKKGIIMLVSKILLSLLIGTSIPGLFGLLLDARGPVIYVIIYTILVNLLFLSRNFSGSRNAKIILRILFIIYTLSVFYILLNILIIPFEAYKTWFGIVGEKHLSGSISFIFMMTASFFSSLFSGLIYKHGFSRPLSGLIFVISVFFTIIFQNILYVSITVISILIWYSIIILLVKGMKCRKKNIMVFIVFLFTISSFAVILSSFKSPHKKWLENRYFDPAITRFVSRNFPEAAILFDVVGYGAPGKKTYLEARPFLSRRRIFKVKAAPGETLYIRTQVYTNYSDGAWDFDRKIVMPAEKEPEFYFFKKNNDTYEIEITTLTDFYSLVPHFLDSECLEIKGIGIPELYYGSKNTGFFLKHPVTPSTIFLISKSKKDKKINLTGEEIKKYLSLPKNLPTSIIRLSKKLQSDSPSTDGTVKKILKYLENTCNYSVNVNPPKSGTDIIEDFLFIQQAGSCTHFTTAFIILARMNNIPSRYITGFLAYVPENNNTVYITGLSAHAWAEIWIPGQGWRIVEATPPMFRENLSNPNYAERFIRNSNRETIEQLSAIVAGEADIQKGKRNIVIKKIDIPVFVIVIPSFLIIAFFAIRLIGKSTLFKTDNEKLKLYAGKILKKLRKKIKSNPASTGWHLWEKECIKKYPTKKKEIKLYIDLIYRSFYSPYVPVPEDVKFVKKLYRNI